MAEETIWEAAWRKLLTEGEAETQGPVRVEGAETVVIQGERYRKVCACVGAVASGPRPGFRQIGKRRWLWYAAVPIVCEACQIGWEWETEEERGESGDTAE